MILKDGEIIAIGKVKTDDTLTGNGLSATPLGINKNLITSAIYFSATSGIDTETEYFSWKGDTLSANSAIKFFNLSFDYNVKPNNTNPDFIYWSQMDVSNANIADKHYIDGFKPIETYSVSFNVVNTGNGTYKFKYSADNNNIDLNNLRVSCIGFINGTEYTPTANIGILSNEKDEFIAFDGNNGETLVLEVD